MSVEKSVYRIEVGGLDITSNISPVLIDLSVSLSAGTSSDTAEINVDDSYGKLKLPTDGAKVKILVGRSGSGLAEVFRGTVNDIKSSGSKSGRTISISCTGMDTKGKAKEPRHKHYDKKTVSSILKDAGKYAGVSDISVASEIGNIVLPFVMQANESFIHLGHRLSVMLGGSFKVMGDKAVMVKRNAHQSVSGQPLVTISAAWGVNLISWEITPVTGRPRHKAIKVRYYDQKKAKWVTEKADTKDKDSIATSTVRYATAGKDEAEQRSRADSAEADRNKGGGSVAIDGDERAQPEAKCMVTGARQGIDGEYLIDSVSHKIDRSGGFSTSLNLKKPK